MRSERQLLASRDFLELLDLIEACGPLQGSAPLDTAKACVRAVEEMEKERDITRLRELVRLYVIPASHQSLDDAHEVLRCARFFSPSFNLFFLLAHTQTQTHRHIHADIHTHTHQMQRARP